MATNAMSSEFAQEMLKFHNSYRVKHDSPGLKINDKISKVAQEWAEHLANKDKAEHRPNNIYGENIYMGMSSDPKWKLKAETAVKAWYDEIKSYKFGEQSPRNAMEVGHFTQLVWKGTKELGIGAAKSKSGRVYVVCNYDPAGNVMSEFAKNVLPINRTSKLRGLFRRSEAANDSDQPEKVAEVEEAPYDRENIVLTPSQEEIGIRFVRPNMKIIESMERLYAVPSEKIRVWSVWLGKIEEKACEWISWLQSHINLVLRISEYLQRAEIVIEEEERKESIGRESEKQYRQDVEIEREKAPATGDVDVEFEESPESVPAFGIDKGADKTRVLEYSINSHRRRSDGRGKSLYVIDTKTTKRASSEEKKRRKTEEKKFRKSSVAEKGNESESRKPSKLENGPSEDGNNEREEGKEGEPRKISGGETSTDEAREERTTSVEGAEKLKRIPWPIGTPWEPVVRVVSSEVSQVPRKKEKEDKKESEVEVITIPENEEDMRSLIKSIKEQATIFRSLYKHWKEAGGQAHNDMQNRRVFDSESVPTHEEIPYFFYVSAEPDIAIGEEHDDEKILLPDVEREKIVSNFTPLYFNLADKPGKR